MSSIRTSLSFELGQTYRVELLDGSKTELTIHGAGEGGTNLDVTIDGVRQEFTDLNEAVGNKPFLSVTKL